MRSTPEQDAKLRERLRAAVDQFSGGSADHFGRLLGYTNGGYVRELLNGLKPVRSAVIERTHAADGLAGWFDGVLSPLSAADLGPPPSADSLFEDSSLLPRFRRLTERQKGAMERVIRDELDRIEGSTGLRVRDVPRSGTGAVGADLGANVQPLPPPRAQRVPRRVSVGEDGLKAAIAKHSQTERQGAVIAVPATKRSRQS